MFNNPFWVAPTYTVASFDYSQAIPQPVEEPPLGITTFDAAASEGTTGTEEDPDTAQAIAIFDTARDLFRRSDFQGALDQVDQAISLLPSDATLHEFRALCLFALQRYKEAAAVIYAVLSAGPGWNWDTMSALYADTEIYTAQLRALEAYKKANPNAPEASFLLAYHYLVLGFPDQSARELQQVVALQPNNQLAAAILDALQNRNQPAELRPEPREL